MNITDDVRLAVRTYATDNGIDLEALGRPSFIAGWYVEAFVRGRILEPITLDAAERLLAACGLALAIVPKERNRG